MAKKRDWIPVGNNMPDTMVDVLISDAYGQVRKAFQNLGGIWIMCNTNSLPSSYYKDEASVLAWMPLPAVYKKYSREGWNPTEKSLPPKDEMVLISTDEEVFISYSRSDGSDMWFLKNNMNSDNWVYLSKSRVKAWMPMPEVFKVAA